MSYCVQSNECPPVLKHYEELNCTAVINEGESCPSYFECPDISSNDPDKCYINGEIYNRGDVIPPEVTRDPCRMCMCDR